MSNIPMRYGPPPPLGSRPASSSMFGRNNDLRFSLRLAEIVRVDYENMVCDLQFLQGTTPPAEEVPISSAYWSKRGFLGAMPSPGSIAIVGYTAVQQAEATRPLILAFLPNGFKTALNFDPIGTAPRGAEEMTLPKGQAYSALEGVYGATRRKFRKIYPGTVYGMSDQGSEIILNEDLHLFDQGGSEILMRAEDGAGILTFRDLYVTTSSGSQRKGRIRRDALSLITDFLGESDHIPEDHPLYEDLLKMRIISQDGFLLGDVNPQEGLITFPSGRKGTFIVRGGKDPAKLGSEFYVEHRTEIREFSDGLLPFSEAHGPDIDSFMEDRPSVPFIEKVSGTLVGNDPHTSTGRAQYGQLLRPSLFAEPSASSGNPRLEVIPNQEGGAEENLAGAYLYRMRRPDGLGELFLSHDKEGHIFLSVPASTAKISNLGAGRSIEADIKGSTKVVMGANAQNNISLDMNLKGGQKVVIGRTASSGRSLDLRASGALVYDIEGKDERGDSIRTLVAGNIAKAVRGSYGISVAEDHLEEVAGQKRVSAESLAHSIGSGDYTVNVMSNKDTNITGTRSIAIGKKDSKVIYTGGEEVEIVSGSSSLSFVAPASRDISFAISGSHVIEAGTSLDIKREAGGQASYSFQAPSGSYSVKLGAGSIDLQAGAGSVKITPGGVQVTGPQITLSGTTSLGSQSASFAVIGGSPGPSPHLDYITGMPLLGNPVVRTM